MILVRQEAMICELPEYFDYIKVMLKAIEMKGRTCYKSHDAITENSAQRFIKMIMLNKHYSVLEHEKISMLFVCSRSTSHQLVRHRLAAYSQESQRYCNYAKDKFSNNVTFIIPPHYKNIEPGIYECGYPVNDKLTKTEINWLAHMFNCEAYYFEQLALGEPAEDARGGLPNDCKTEIVVTYNLRQWLHVFDVRCDGAAQRPIRELFSDALVKLYNVLPEIYETQYNKLEGK